MIAPVDTNLATAAARYPVAAASTAYCEPGVTASGAWTRWGMVAQNTLRFGTRIVLRRPIRGRRTFRVMDHYGHGTELDVFMTSCSAALAYGRRVVWFRVARSES